MPTSSLIEEVVECSPAHRFCMISDGVGFLDGKKDMKEKLMQWGLSGLKVSKYRFTCSNGVYETLRDFFVETGILGFKQNEVKLEELNTESVDLGLFTRLKSKGLVAENGDLRKCPEERIDGATCSTLLCDALINEESLNADIFNEEERKELLFQLLQILIIGGPLNQFEENIKPYFQVLKELYKSLVHVTKDSVSNGIKVTSKAFRVPTGDKNMHSRCFVIYNQHQHTITCLLNIFKP